MQWYALKTNGKIIAAILHWEWPKLVDFKVPIMKYKNYEIIEAHVIEHQKISEKA